MTNMHLLNRSGLAAITAATAFLSTPALAQDAAPVTAEPAPIVADAPLPSEPATPPAAETDTLAPVTATATTTAIAKAKPSVRNTNTARATAAPAKPAVKSAVRTAEPVVAAAPAAVTSTPADPAMVAPLPEPVAATPVVEPTSSSSNDMLPIAGAAGLGILALAGAGFAMRRRRRDDDEVMVQDEWHEPVIARAAPVAPVVAATPLAASAVSWGSTPATAPTSASDDLSINRIAAAKRGPTPDNPSLSLKKRLKRAAFFDQRDRQIAAGKGTPIAASAGLPDAMTAMAPKPTATRSEPSRRPSPAISMSFGKTFQPA